MTDYYIQLQDIDVDGDGDKDNIEYHFKLISNLDENGNITFTSIESDNPLNNQQLGLSGKTKEININWVIYDNGNDKSDGTWGNQLGSNFDSNLGSDIVTVEDQIYYLQNYIHEPALGAQWRLFGGRFTDPDGDGTDDGTPVVVQRLRTPRQSTNPNSVNASIVLKVGQGI